MKIIKYLLITILTGFLTASLIYVLFVFTTLEFNPLLWTEITRIMYSVILVINLIIGIPLLIIFISDNVSQDELN